MGEEEEVVVVAAGEDADSEGEVNDEDDVPEREVVSSELVESTVV